MKKILITGKNSYIGSSLEKWLGNYQDKYSIDMISLRDNSWETHTFSLYDVVVHVAGIAHIKESKNNTNLYFKVNRDLAFNVAKKAKGEGVKQFIFISSMSVYGIVDGVIDINTPSKPKSNYGKSKLEAEGLISSLEDDVFKVSILRPPMVYGPGCKGNYQKLSKLILKFPFFPEYPNKRSMIFIDNLNEFIRLIIENEESGIYFPQNKTYVCTTDLVKIIAKVHNKNIYTTSMFNTLLKKPSFKIIQKIFGNLIYDLEMSKYKEDYCLIQFNESIYLSENNKPS